VLERGGTDNVTIVLVKIKDKGNGLSRAEGHDR
jgi:serine/threonine protein phosphatase PrpC